MNKRISIDSLRRVCFDVGADLSEKDLVSECVPIPMARGIARTGPKALGLPLLENAA